MSNSFIIFVGGLIILVIQSVSSTISCILRSKHAPLSSVTPHQSTGVSSLAIEKTRPYFNTLPFAYTGHGFCAVHKFGKFGFYCQGGAQSMEM